MAARCSAGVLSLCAVANFHPRWAGARRLSLGRQGLKCESLAPLVGPEGDTVGDGTAEDLGQAIVIVRLEGDMAVVEIPHQQALALKVAADAVT